MGDGHAPRGVGGWGIRVAVDDEAGVGGVAGVGEVPGEGVAVGLLGGCDLALEVGGSHRGN